MRLAWLMGAVVISLAISCTTEEEKQEILAKQYCGSCHAYPEPSLLSKESWRTVMPQMAVRMGIDISVLLRLSEEDYPYVIQTLPQKPMISEHEFDQIIKYYEREAPEILPLPSNFEGKQLTQFEVTQHKLLNTRPTICMFQADTVKKEFWVANRNRVLYRYNYDFKKLDSIKISSVASSMIIDPMNPLAALMGYMDPNDQPKGSVLDLTSGKTIIDSLKRPVHINRADFNKDNKEDIVVCSFGNYGGALSVYENANGKYIEHQISGLPGSRKTVVRDFNNDGLPDILVLFSQGDENISLYTNAGNFRFRVTTLLKFPPVYGSEFFDVVDFNKDGYWDLVTVNGDNADYSMELKPYHGVRIFLNDGQNRFKESWFHHLDGASIVWARDFDKDGDIDLAATSFFPDFKNHPEHGFVYFENNGGNLEPYTTPLAGDARWMLMETADIDADGYTDIILAALDFETQGAKSLEKKWMENPIDIMVLKNKGKK